MKVIRIVPVSFFVHIKGDIQLRNSDRKNCFICFIYTYKYEFCRILQTFKLTDHKNTTFKNTLTISLTFHILVDSNNSNYPSNSNYLNDSHYSSDSNGVGSILCKWQFHTTNIFVLICRHYTSTILRYMDLLNSKIVNPDFLMSKNSKNTDLSLLIKIVIGITFLFKINSMDYSRKSSKISEKWT